MLVQCARCGAPLNVEDDGQRYAECLYCGNVNRLRKTKTLALETPPGWQPPDEWRPPKEARAPSGRVLRRRAGRPWYVVLAAGIGRTLAAFLLPLLPVAVVLGVTLYAVRSQLAPVMPQIEAALERAVQASRRGGEEQVVLGDESPRPWGDAAGAVPAEEILGCRCRLDLDGRRGRERVSLELALGPVDGKGGRTVSAELLLASGRDAPRWVLPLGLDTAPPARLAPRDGAELAFGVACHDDLFILVDQRHATAWSAGTRTKLWSTPVDEPRLSGGTRGRFDGVRTRCVTLSTRDGFLRVREGRVTRKVRLRDGTRM